MITVSELTKRYGALREPLRQVGALLDAGTAHPSRSALDHLRSIAAAGRIAERRVAAVLEQAGLELTADRLVIIGRADHHARPSDRWGRR